jgi:hypothetical protein
VRRALEEMYAKIAEAQPNEDIEALRATRTPDFTVDLPNGQKWDLEAPVGKPEAYRDVLRQSRGARGLMASPCRCAASL